MLLKKRYFPKSRKSFPSILSMVGEGEMRKVLFVWLIFAVAIIYFISPSNPVSAKKFNRTTIYKKIKTLLIPFIENKGQFNKQILYYSKTFSGAVFINKKGEIGYLISGKKGSYCLKEKFIGNRIVPKQICGEEKSKTQIHYFLGQNPKKWLTHLQSYNLVSLGRIYNGITLKVKAHSNNIEKLFYISPNVNPSKILVRVTGANKLKITKTGALDAITNKGIVQFSPPKAYQIIDHHKRYIEISYLVVGKNQYKFTLGNYNKNKELIIDPFIGSTFLGGKNWDEINSIAIDSSGNVYVAGDSESPLFPATYTFFNFTNPNSNSTNSTDTFVAKLDANLTTLVSSALIGGLQSDVATGIAIDPSTGDIYVTGWTNSYDFPITYKAYQTGLNGTRDGFIICLSSDLSTLNYSTYIGGNSTDVPTSIAINNSDIYITGYTCSKNFIPKYLQKYYNYGYDSSLNGTQDAFVAVLNSNLSALITASYLGGSKDDSAQCIKFNSLGEPYIVGWTTSSDFPVTAGAYDTSFHGTEDAFVAEINATTLSPIKATYLGGSIAQEATSLALDSSGNVYVTGWTCSPDFPTHLGAQNAFAGCDDAFVAKLNSDLSTLLSSTFIGGEFYDGAFSIALNSLGDVYVVGITGSKRFPINSNSYDISLNGTSDAFVAKLTNSLNTISQITYVGGSNDDWAKCLTIDSSNNVYMAGWTCSYDFPVTANAYDTTYNGTGYLADAFVSKLDANLSDPVREYSTIKSQNNNNENNSNSGGSGGCTMKKNQDFSPILPLMLIIPAILIYKRGKKKVRNI